MKARTQFTSSLRTGARLALFTGKIKLSDWFRVQGVLLNSKRKTSEGTEVDIIQEVAEHCLDVGKADSKISAEITIESEATAVDWTAITTWIKENMASVMAFIAEILALFEKKSD
jgi:hypothetical protein